MRFFILASIALASLVSGVPADVEERAVLNCQAAGLFPYCCTAGVSVPELDIVVGVECTQRPTKSQMSKPQFSCPATSVKLCCTDAAPDLLGLITLCQLPAGVVIPPLPSTIPRPKP